MRVYLTGATGFVGSNVARVFGERHGARLFCRVVLVSTDWVFDGTQVRAREDTPPNPINLYGFLKAASELVVSERAAHAAVARIAGVNGVHWARPEAPRRQDAGFGYFVLALVEVLRAGRRFTVWRSPAINMVATLARFAGGRSAA